MSQRTPEDEVDNALGAIQAAGQQPLPSTPHSPETEVADYLRLIGDRVNVEFGPQIDSVAKELMMNDEEITYEGLQALALRLLKETAAASSGWSKVRVLC